MMYPNKVSREKQIHDFTDPSQCGLDHFCLHQTHIKCCFLFHLTIESGSSQSSRSV